MPAVSALQKPVPDRPGDAIALKKGELELELWPSIGGGVAGFAWQQAGQRIELMRRATPRAVLERDGRYLASFPLFPFSNRIKDGRFPFGGRAVELVRNTPPDHPIHGHVWQRPSMAAAVSSSAAELVCSYPGGDWPWTYTASQRFALAPDALTVELEIRNDSYQPMRRGPPRMA